MAEFLSKSAFTPLKTEIEKARDDAENHAQALTSFQDAEGDSFDKGAKGWSVDAEASKTAAETAESNASTSASNAATSESNASDSANAASTSATNAAESETNAATSETNAATSETNAANSETAAETAKTNAETAQTAAETARDKAQDWAEEDEDVEVESGQYSAKHHALKAAEQALLALQGIKFDDTVDTEANLPDPPPEGNAAVYYIEDSNSGAVYNSDTTSWDVFSMGSITVVDDLNSTSSTNALSANQGKHLEDNKLEKDDSRLTYATPEQYGYTGNDKTADTAAFQDMLANESNIFLSDTYVLNSVSGTRDHYNIVGNGEATLDFSNVTDNTNSANADFLLEGSYTQIADLSADVSRKDKQVTFATAHGLSAGDTFIIYNPTDNSWSPHRIYYRKGEICRVKNVVDTTTVDLYSGLFDDYTAANINVYKMSPINVNLENFKVIGGERYGIWIDYGDKPRIKNIEFEGVFEHTLRLSETIGGIISGCTINQTDVATLYSYGIIYGSSQNLTIKDCDLYTRGDSIEHGQGADFDFPSRNITIENCFAAGVISQHGFAEYTKVRDCFAYAITVGGNNAQVYDCDVLTTMKLSREPVGCNFSAIENKIYNLGGVVAPLTAQQCTDAQFNGYADQLLEITGNRVYNGRVSISSAATTYGMRYIINDNYIQTNEDVDGYYPGKAFSFNSLAFDSFEMEGNTLFGIPDFIFTNAKSGALVDIENNKFHNGTSSGVIRGNNDCVVNFKNNKVLNNERVDGSGITNTNVYFDEISELYLEDNKIGDTVSGGNSNSWIGIADTDNVYMKGNSNLKQDNNTIFWGGTSSASSLKPYPSYPQKKSWDPVFGTTGTGFTEITMDDVTDGDYTVVDNVVFFRCIVGTDSLDVGSASGGITITGLPFTNTGTNSTISISFMNGWTHGPQYGRIGTGQDFISLEKITTLGGDFSSSVPADMTDGATANKNRLRISGFYFKG